MYGKIPQAFIVLITHKLPHTPVSLERKTITASLKVFKKWPIKSRNKIVFLVLLFHDEEP